MGNCGWRNAVYEISAGTASFGNVALGASTSQSSNSWGSTDGGRAVDGNSGDGSWGSASCTHTQNGDPEWWQVDLGGSYSITDLSIYHRTDCCQDRLVGADITLSRTSDYSMGIACWASTDGGNVAQPETGSCGGAIGNFITVSHSGRYITICEFEAQGSAQTAVEGSGVGAIGVGTQVIVCESQTATMTCETGTVSIIYATYGRVHDASVCQHSAVSDQTCHADTSLDIVRAACDGEVTCDVAATNGVFGDPCGGTYKYLTVDFTCSDGGESEAAELCNGQPTAQSSNGWGFTDGGRAVDGNTGDGSWGSASCTHTQNGDPE